MVAAQASALIGPKPASLTEHEMLAEVCFGSLARDGGPEGT
jgi:hypothetical protein